MKQKIKNIKFRDGCLLELAREIEMDDNERDTYVESFIVAIVKEFNGMVENAKYIR